jgi:hypothetical protein
VIRLVVLLALFACRPAPTMEGRYSQSVDGEVASLDFDRDGSVMFYPEQVRLTWKRSNDTVFVNGPVGTQSLVLLVRGDSLVFQIDDGGRIVDQAFVRQRP